MKRYDIAIFDCDGVIFDTKECNRQYYNDLAKKIRKEEITEVELSFVHMHTAEESIDYLFRNKPHLLDKARKYIKELDYGNYMGYMKPEPNVFETLAAIKKELSTALFTNRSTTMPRLIKEFSLNRCFDKIVCALDVERTKPYPDGMLKILREFDVHREKAIYIGDTSLDEEAAQRAKVAFIAYKNRELTADFHVEHFFQIKEIILSS